MQLSAHIGFILLILLIYSSILSDILINLTIILYIFTTYLISNTKEILMCTSYFSCENTHIL